MSDAIPETKTFKSLREFFPFYLTEHSHPINRALHFIGTSLALGFLLSFISTVSWKSLLGALISGYLFAWIGHFIIERNRPATFKYPFYSFVSDWMMYGLMLIGKIPKKSD